MKATEAMNREKNQSAMQTMMEANEEIRQIKLFIDAEK